MKKLRISFVILLAVYFTHCTRSSEKRVDVISFYYYYGDGTDYLFFGTSNAAIDSTYKSNPSDREIVERYNPQKIVVNSKALNALAEHISESCNNSDTTLKDMSVWTVSLYSGTEESRCQLIGIEEVKRQSRDLIKWIDGSKYKEDLKDVRARLNPYQNL